MYQFISFFAKGVKTYDYIKINGNSYIVTSEMGILKTFQVSPFHDIY